MPKYPLAIESLQAGRDEMEDLLQGERATYGERIQAIQALALIDIASILTEVDQKLNLIDDRLATMNALSPRN